MSAAQLGLVTLGAGGDEVTAGPLWRKSAAGISPAPNHPGVRFNVSSDPNNVVHVDALKRASADWRQGVFGPQQWVLHSGLFHPQGSESPRNPDHFPNASLGYNGNPLLNWYILYFAEFVVRTLNECGEDLPDEVVIWNEPNLLAGNVSAGDTHQYADPATGSALSPDVWGAMVHHVSQAIRQSTKVKVIRPGSYSLLLSMKTDPRSIWFQGHWEQAIDYVNSVMGGGGLTLDGISLNMEGLVDTLSGAQYVAAAMRDVMAYGQWSGKLTIGEFGVPAGNLNAALVADTCSHLAQTMDEIFWYAHHVRQPGVLTGYGAQNYRYGADGTFEPTDQTALYPFLQKLFPYLRGAGPHP